MKATPHHHRWVDGFTPLGEYWWCHACNYRRGVTVCRGKGGCWEGRCVYHDPRRPPTPAEREERRVLLRAACMNGRLCPCMYRKRLACPREPWTNLGFGLGENLGRILESAAYSWTGGPQ